MFSLQHTKYVPAILPAAIVDNNTVAAKAIDLAGVGYTEIVVSLGATDIALTAMKLQEADEKSGDTLTSPTDIPGCVFGTSKDADGNASTLPSATDDNKVYVFRIPSRGRKRYIKPVVTVGDGTAGAFVTALAVQGNLASLDQLQASRGAAAILTAAYE